MNKIIKKLIAVALVVTMATGCSAANESSNTGSNVSSDKESSSSAESSISSSTESESSSSESSSESSSSESISESSSSGESSTSEPEEKKDGITLYGKLYLILTNYVVCNGELESTNNTNYYNDINYTVFDKDGNEVFKGNLIKNMNDEFSMYDGIAFEMQVPEWKEDSTYKVAFENLPEDYSEYLIATRTNKETFQVETTMNENGKYNATVDIEYFFYESSYTDPATGKTSIVKQE